MEVLWIALTTYNTCMSDITREELIALVRQQGEAIASRDEEIAELREQLETMHYRVAQMSRRIYGNTAERFAPQDGQVMIPGLVPGVAEVSTSDRDDDDDPDGPRGGGKGRSKKAAKKKRGRLKIPEHIERVDQIIEPSEDDRRDAQGKCLVKLREEITEKLDYIAGGFRVLRIIRPVYGLGDGSSISASPPPQVVDRGLPTDRTVAMVLSEKFDLHNPLYRQQDRFARAGIAVPRSTLGNWIGPACAMLSPIVDAIASEVRASSVIHLDDTTIQRLAPGTGRTHTARFWGYLGEGSLLVRYADNRAGSHPQEFLHDWSGHIMADAYSGHEKLYADGRRLHIPCMAHVRRKFYESYRDAGDKRAQHALGMFRELYDLEGQWRDHPPDAIAVMRRSRARSVLQQLYEHIASLRRVATPASPLGKACTYFLNLWPRLHHYTSAGHLPIDNNALERLWKPVALGRKNYLFVGNETGGERAAIAYSILLSCRLAGIDGYRYLCDTFAELHTGTHPAELTPKAWAQRQHHTRAA